MAEWLGRGLQNLVRRFESARDLKPHHNIRGGAFLCPQDLSLLKCRRGHKKGISGGCLIGACEAPTTGSLPARAMNQHHDLIQGLSLLKGYRRQKRTIIAQVVNY